MANGICSRCGKRMVVGPRSLPPGRRTCQECRRGNPQRSPKVPTARVCELCEESYVPKPGHRPGQRFCSKSCTTAWSNGARPPYTRRYAGDAATRSLAKARARRLRHAETWDGITDEEILDRDGWRCQVPACKRRPIRKDLKFPHPRSKSIDHIVPLSLGGDDTAVNKRAAHLGCNVARAANVGHEQMALFGSLREAPLLARISGAGPVRVQRERKIRVCGICGEELAGRTCELHLPVYVRTCGFCGELFTARRRRKLCERDACKKRRFAANWRRQMASAEARARKRVRDRERRWVDPAYRERAIAATARWHERQRAASGGDRLW